MSASDETLTTALIVDHYIDSRAALRAYFGNPHADPARFTGASPADVARDLHERLAELELSQSLILLAAIEASFRIDFEKRCAGRKRAKLAKTFRQIRKTRGERIRLEEDILETWKAEGSLSRALIGDIKGALKLRHWLAHGRYWTAKLGRKYDFDSLVALAEALDESDLLLS